MEGYADHIERLSHESEGYQLPEPNPRVRSPLEAMGKRLPFCVLHTQLISFLCCRPHGRHNVLDAEHDGRPRQLQTLRSIPQAARTRDRPSARQPSAAPDTHHRAPGTVILHVVSRVHANAATAIACATGRQVERASGVQGRRRLVSVCATRRVALVRAVRRDYPEDVTQERGITSE
jgi:hypothetical protein